MVGPITITWEPTSVHVLPSADLYAENVSPRRASFTQYGAATAPPAVFAEMPLATALRWNAAP